MATMLLAILVLVSHIRVTRAACDLTAGCYPPIFDVTSNLPSFPGRSLTVSSVCGENGSEEYLNFLTSDFKTYNCTAASVPATNMMDGSDSTFWQSSVGDQPQAVEIRFTDRFLIFELLVTFAVPHLGDGSKSADARPLAWTVEKLAEDGVTWTPLRHFAKDCTSSFPGVPIRDPFSLSNVFSVVYCDQYLELEEDEQFLNADNLVAYYPGLMDVYSPYAYKNNPQVANYFTSAGLRLSFTSLSRVLPKQRYVAIRQLRLDVRCQCNGHAEICSGPNQASCECQHFTTGQYCEACQPLYNNRTWSTGKTTGSGACQECSCNNHASSCVYDETKNYGICQDCQDNTDGSFCETCAAGYYINASWASSGDNNQAGAYCLPCECSESGTLPGLLTSCDVKTGQCSCKANVQGRDCTECKDTFFGLKAESPDGCSVCQCNPSGTVGDNSMCNKTSGACLCRNNIQGVSCDTCKANTYGFNPVNPDGCLPCECDPGGSSGLSCHLTTGQCTCRTDISSRSCAVPIPGTYVPKLDLILLEPELTSSDGMELRSGHGTEGVSSSGRGLVSVTSAKQLELTFTAGYGGLMNMAVRYEKTTVNGLVFLKADVALTTAQSYSCGDIVVSTGQTWTLSKTVIDNSKTGVALLGQVCLGKGFEYSLSLANSGDSLLVDSVVFLPDKESLQAGLSGSLDTVKVDGCYESALASPKPNRQACQGVEYSLMAAFIGGAQVCNCAGGSLDGQVCDAYSGDCDCKMGVLPPSCNTCRADYYQFSVQSGCIACGCHVNGSMNEFCSTLGVCQCRPNVQGNKCDSCFTDHYGLYTGKGCQPCLCNQIYSVGSSCDDSGQCVCKPGVGGRTCFECADSHYNLTSSGCTRCACDPSGSTGVGCDQSTGVCQCRNNVEGTTCDTCKTGYFGLGVFHPGGCLPCFCWGKGQTCTSATGLSAVLAQSPPTLLPDGWTAANTTGSYVSTFVDGSGLSFMLKLSALQDTGSDIYFVAPAKYLGDKSSTYGRYLILAVKAFSLSANASAVNITADVIVEGQYADKALMHTITILTNEATQTIRLPMRESSWQDVDKTTLKPDQLSQTTATFEEMMKVLTSVSALKIQAFDTERADYTLSLNSLELETGSGSPITNVEMCECQEGYTGKHCEICAPGFTRSVLGSQDPSSQCVPCQCNGHAQQTCDPNTGVCTDLPCDPVSGVCTCTHHTEGDSCQKCQVGYYGDPTKGTPDDCLPCACPGIVVNGEVNVFASSCFPNSQGAPVCTNCTLGHQGDNCGICMDGYYGTPENATNAGGTCRSCVCNERADTCHPRTGECVDCRNDTAGQQCDICAAGYFGDAMTFSCKECVCKNFPGSTGQCDPTTGHCECLPNVEGIQCDQCKAGTFNLQPLVGCEPCDCHKDGSLTPVCDTTTGQCNCRGRVQGRQCDVCQDSFWNINSVTGCDACNCNQEGTAKNGSNVIQTCDLETGQCQCGLPGTIGRTCDTCSPVTTYQLSYVQLFYLGNFPDCRLCGECFDSWGLTIDAIGQETVNLQETSLAIWEQFNKQTAETIDASLSLTEDKIQRASQSVGAFQQLAQDLVLLQDRFSKATFINEGLSSQADTLLGRRGLLQDRLAAIEALTAVITTTQGTATSVAALSQEMASLRDRTQASVNLGKSSWDSVQTLAFVVADPADRERQLQQQAKASMAIANLANDTYKLADLMYQTSLKPMSEDTAEELISARQQQADASNRLATVQSTASEVTLSIASIRSSLSSLVGASEKAKTDTLNMVKDLQNVVSDASSAQRSVENIQVDAEKFLAAAQQAESTMRDSMSTLLDNLAALTKAQNDLVSSQTQSTSVLAISLRPLDQLENLMTDIGAVPVSSTDVQAVELKAQKALVLAEDALLDTQKALGLAREVNQEVVIMEEAVQAARNLKTQAQGLRSAADMVHGEITQITTQVEGHINSTLSDISEVTDSSSQVMGNVSAITDCIELGQTRVQEATTSASRAEERAQTTSQNQQVLIDLMLDINTQSGDQTVSQALSDLKQGSTVLDQLVTGRKEVEALTDIQGLVQELVAQTQELTALDSEINGLSTQLDELLLSLEENLSGASCNT